MRFPTHAASPIRVEYDLRPILVTRDGEQRDHDQGGQEVGHDGNKNKELGQLLGRPRPLEVSSAMV